MIKKLGHAALSVADMEKSLSFYRDLLGLEVIRMIEPDPKIGLGNVVGIPDCLARIAHLKKGDNMLELFEYVKPRGNPISKDFTQAGHGYTHIGFESDDIHGDYARFKEWGVRFINEPVEFRKDVWIVYFYGPDGEVCELRQIKNEKAE
ncbi:MAG: VOC family protein [Spirochaetes bacterium]|nr:VOC family protein [Spirochaetota bacterium]